MNISRSKVRQCALSFLYTYLTNGCQPVDGELFWSIAQEKERDHLRTALAQAVLHACRDAVDSARLLADRLEQVENHIDHMTSNIGMPIGGLAIAIVGGYLAWPAMRKQMHMNETVPAWLETFVKISIKFISPAVIVVIALAGLLG